MKNLVIGFSTNQAETDLSIFCKTLRKIYTPEECDLVIITNRYYEYFKDLSKIGVDFTPTVSEYISRANFTTKFIKKAVLNSYRLAARAGISSYIPIEIRNTYPILLEAWHHPHFTRWVAYQRFMTLNRNYDQVLISDVRDVAFQDRFFDSRQERVGLFTELEPFGPDAGLNTGWYRDAWGEKELSRALGKLPVCIGTILGPFDGMLSIVNEIVDYFGRHPFNRVEQAVFNKMLIDDVLTTPFSYVDNITGPVATLSSIGAKAQTAVQSNKVCRLDGSVIPVVHMYDRYADTKDLYSWAV